MVPISFALIGEGGFLQFFLKKNLVTYVGVANYVESNALERKYQLFIYLFIYLFI